MGAPAPNSGSALIKSDLVQGDKQPAKSTELTAGESFVQKWFLHWQGQPASSAGPKTCFPVGSISLHFPRLTDQ